MSWIVLGVDKSDQDRRGLAWSDNELYVTHGGKKVGKVTLQIVD